MYVVVEIRSNILSKFVNLYFKFIIFWVKRRRELSEKAREKKEKKN